MHLYTQDIVITITVLQQFFKKARTLLKTYWKHTINYNYNFNSSVVETWHKSVCVLSREVNKKEELSPDLIFPAVFIPHALFLLLCHLPHSVSTLVLLLFFSLLQCASAVAAVQRSTPWLKQWREKDSCWAASPAKDERRSPREPSSTGTSNRWKRRSSGMWVQQSHTFDALKSASWPSSPAQF